MTENKLYQLCREEAARQMIQKNSHLSPPIAAVLCDDEIKQLTAEIYGMKLLDMAAKVFLPTVASGAVKYWQKDHYQNKEYYYSTKEVHNHFVEQFNKEGK